MGNYIKGKFMRHIYKGKKGYVIGLFKLEETNDENMKEHKKKVITFTGHFPDLKEEDTYIFYGKDTTHPKYGFQYEVSKFERIKPDDKDGMIEFLSSNLFKGVGKVMATKIVETLGEKALEKIIENHEILLTVDKMKETTSKSIHNTLIEYEESHKTIIYLTELSFSTKDAIEIYEKYKKETTSIVKTNPYKLCIELNSISFNKIDLIARANGVEIDDERRISAAVLHTINNVCFQSGNTFVVMEEISKQASYAIESSISEENLRTALKDLEKTNLVIKSDEKYYPLTLHNAEENIANMISYLTKVNTGKMKSEKYIENLEKHFGISYGNKQKEAIKKSINSNVLVITGGPGTGKTTIIQGIVELYKKHHKLNYESLIKEIALLAPTGRAAKRISEETLLPASTIHRYLKWNKDTDEFGYNEFNKHNHKFIIIDEVSMIDTALLSNLFKALTHNIKLILVGDADQLPSVGPGQVLKDIIDSDMVDVVYLDLLYRQHKGSTITQLAHDIKDEEINMNLEDKKDDFSFIRSSNDNIVKNVESICKKALEKGYKEEDIQILAPMYKGINGIDILNVRLQNLFNPPSNKKRELDTGEIKYRENDKVLQLVNMPDEDIYNGDIGKIIKIKSSKESESKRNEIFIDYDGRTVRFTPANFVKFKHGYAISIHKAQGSEFKTVILPISQSYRIMLSKRIIYTAVTRAKESLIILGEEAYLRQGIKINRENNRNTSLKEKIIKKMENDSMEELSPYNFM